MKNWTFLCFKKKEVEKTQPHAEVVWLLLFGLNISPQVSYVKGWVQLVAISRSGGNLGGETCFKQITGALEITACPYPLSFCSLCFWWLAFIITIALTLLTPPSFLFVSCPPRVVQIFSTICFQHDGLPQVSHKCSQVKNYRWIIWNC